MKVLYLTNLPAPYKVKFFEKVGKLCELTVLYERKVASDRDDKWTAVHNDTFQEIFLKGKEIGADNSFSLDTIRYIKRKEYDCIIVGMYSTYTAIAAIIYMKLHKIPFWISTDGGFIKEESPYKYRFKRFLIGAASGWLTTGYNATNYFVHYGADESRCFVYPFTSICEADVLDKPVCWKEKEIFRRKLDMKEDKIILSVGQFIYRKGYDILLRTWADMDKNVGLYFVGGIPTEEYIELQELMGLSNVHFVDFMTKSELAEYYKAADLFVLPTREDVWGLVINEAMAYGLPVITTNKCIAGLELLTNACYGRIIEDIENTQSWLKSIKGFLDGTYSYSSEQILKRASQYTLERMAEETLRIISFTSQQAITYEQEE